jgi:hypothetical protein
MTTPGDDHRSPRRRARDEEIAAEPQLASPEFPPDAVPSPVEAHLSAHARQLRAILDAADRRIDEGAGIGHDEFWKMYRRSHELG